MSLYHMPVEAAIGPDAALNIHLGAYLPQSKVCFQQCFLYCGNGIILFGFAHHCETYPVVGDALVYAQFIYKRAGQTDVQVFLFFFKPGDNGRFFHDP